MSCPATITPIRIARNEASAEARLLSMIGSTFGIMSS